MLVYLSALFLTPLLASSCDSADKAIWDTKGKANFSADEKKCALRCGGQNPCTGNCMSETLGYTHACGQCFGDLSSCVVAHCVVAPGNCGVNENGEACKSCTNQYCTPAFETCTGFTPPAAAATLEQDDTEGLPNIGGLIGGICDKLPARARAKVPFCKKTDDGQDADDTAGPQELEAASWCQYIPKAAQKYVPECASADLEATTPELSVASWCKWVPVPAQKYVPECASADLESTGPELSVAPWCRFITNPNTIRLLPECRSATSETLEATRLTAASWCPYIPKAARKYVPECPSADLESTSPELSVASWCQYIPKAAIVYVPECASAVSDELKAPAKFE